MKGDALDEARQHFLDRFRLWSHSGCCVIWFPAALIIGGRWGDVSAGERRRATYSMLCFRLLPSPAKGQGCTLISRPRFPHLYIPKDSSPMTISLYKAS